LLWTAFDPDSLYNTVFKIAYIGSSPYIIYLMLNDYQSTHDPNIDTFKVEYLLGASAVLAVFAPNRFTYTSTEVCWQGWLIPEKESKLLLIASRYCGPSPYG